MIANYLLSLEGQLKYQFTHIEEENMTDFFMKNLTARKLIVTNEFNTIQADPEIGFEILKGNEKKFFVNQDGDIEYSGILRGAEIIGSRIASEFIDGTTKIILEQKDVTLSINVYETDNWIALASFQHSQVLFQTSLYDTSYRKDGITLKYNKIPFFQVSNTGGYLNGSKILTESSSTIQNIIERLKALEVA